MMQLARRALLLVALLLASAGTASAEGAWVLWWETSVFASEDGRIVRVLHEPWDIFDSYESKGGCEAAVKEKEAANPSRLMRALVEMSIVPEKRSPRERLALRPDSSWMVNFRCLPDTVDPRGPKGGGR